MSGSFIFDTSPKSSLNIFNLNKLPTAIQNVYLTLRNHNLRWNAFFEIPVGQTLVDPEGSTWSPDPTPPPEKSRSYRVYGTHMMYVDVRGILYDLYMMYVIVRDILYDLYMMYVIVRDILHDLYMMYVVVRDIPYLFCLI